MYKISSILRIGDKYCVSVEGDSLLLKNGIKLNDEKGNIYTIESIGMVHYENVEKYKTHAELILKGDIGNIGKTLMLLD